MNQVLLGQNASLVTSDLKRASQTAEYIARALNQPLHLDPSLREINNGQGANKSHAEADRIRQPIVGPRLDWQPYPEAETWRAFYWRTVAGVEKIIENYPGPLVVCLSTDYNRGRRKDAEKAEPATTDRRGA
jgi:probable phosphoglycerate mutase